MKKIIALILAMAMALALVACGGDNSTNNDAQDGNTPAANGTTVYVLGPPPRPRRDGTGRRLCPGQV